MTHISKEHPNYPGYYIISNSYITDYIINDNYQVITLVDRGWKNKTGSILVNYTDINTGLVTTNIKCLDGKQRKLGVKVLLEYAKNGYIEKIKVIKTDDDKDPHLPENLDYTKRELYLSRIDDFPTTGEMAMSQKEKDILKSNLIKRLDKLEKQANKNKGK